MKKYAITSGKFTGKGNFTGYDALGNRIHVHQAQMNSLGWAKDADVKFPFFAVGAEKEIGQLDENGAPKMENGVAVLVKRLTATSVFASKADLTSALVDVATLDIEITKAVKATATAAGLTESEVSALVTAAV